MDPEEEAHSGTEEQLMNINDYSQNGKSSSEQEAE
jgi:hypothetical protein